MPILDRLCLQLPFFDALEEIDNFVVRLACILSLIATSCTRPSQTALHSFESFKELNKYPK